MVEIIPTDMTPPENDSREFHPMRGVGNRHLQTMLPRLIRRKLRFTPHWQRLELPDGDFVDLAWSEDPHQARHKPRLVVFHGLEGSLHSPYAHGLIHAAMQRDWLGVVMHFAAAAANLTAITASITPAKQKMAPGFCIGYSASLAPCRPQPSAIH